MTTASATTSVTTPVQTDRPDDIARSVLRRRLDEAYAALPTQLAGCESPGLADFIERWNLNFPEVDEISRLLAFAEAAEQFKPAGELQTRHSIKLLRKKLSSAEKMRDTQPVAYRDTIAMRLQAHACSWVTIDDREYDYFSLVDFIVRTWAPAWVALSLRGRNDGASVLRFANQLRNIDPITDYDSLFEAAPAVIRFRRAARKLAASLPDSPGDIGDDAATAMDRTGWGPVFNPMGDMPFVEPTTDAVRDGVDIAVAIGRPSYFGEITRALRASAQLMIERTAAELRRRAAS